MAKLSTNELKKLITTWLSTEESRNEIKHLWDIDDSDVATESWDTKQMETPLQREVRYGGLPSSIKTVEQFAEHLWKLWTDGSQWKRREKRALKDEAEDTFSETDWSRKPENWEPGRDIPIPTKPAFPIDVLGSHDQALVEKFYNDPVAARKCIYRYFSPAEPFEDNYRLEVVTTPEDDQVVGWWVTVD